MNLDYRLIDPLIKTALDEDLPWGDITTESLIDPEMTSELAIVLKQDGVIAGLPLVKRIFETLDPDLEWKSEKEDGEYLTKGTILAKVKGNSQALLKAERLALNFLQRLSGVATITHKYLQKARTGSETVRVVDTRKTTPGLRYLEKYAVRMGGGWNHRYCLSDSILIKDNHLAMLKASGKSFTEAILEARAKVPHTTQIEIEVDRLDQIPGALEAGVDSILLDNMTYAELREAVKMIDGKALTEASGGVNYDTIAEIAACGIDIISVGALTHSAGSLDISLDYL